MSATKGKYEVANDAEQSPARGGFLNFIYDREAGRVMGRTGKSWVQIIVFYIIYYCCLAGFFCGMMSVFLYGIIPEERPHLTGQQSLLRLNPGLGFRPLPQPESSLIAFTAGANSTYDPYVRNLMKLYSSYQKPIDQAARRASCDRNASDQDPAKVCQFDWDANMPDCLPANVFGYASGRPCVVLKLNRVFGWLPDPVDPATPHPTVQCFGENAADAENLGTLSYQPAAPNNSAVGFFSQVYFPYLKQTGYQAPLVALIFEKLPANTLVMVECRLGNLHNAYYDRMDRQAMVRFDIFMQK